MSVMMNIHMDYHFTLNVYSMYGVTDESSTNHLGPRSHPCKSTGLYYAYNHSIFDIYIYR